MTKGVSEGFSTTHESDLCNHHHGGGGRWKSPTFAWRIGSPELMRWGQSEYRTGVLDTAKYCSGTVRPSVWN
jgi:hypothetical protein